MRINQACEVTDHATNFRLKIVTSTLEKLRSASAFGNFKLSKKQEASRRLLKKIDDVQLTFSPKTTV
jgi:hypothetical protein